MKSIILVFIFVTGCFCADWNYDDTNWGVNFPDCIRFRQTPINLVTLDMQLKLYTPGLKYQYMRQTPKSVTIKNGGHGPVFTYEWNGPTPQVSGGPLPGIFVFNSLHFHWGPFNSVGSEHTFNGKSDPIEGHFIFVNSKYGTLTNALNYGDGLSVLGIRYSCSLFPTLTKFFTSINFVVNIPNYEETITLLSPSAPSFSELIGSSSIFSYAHYPGSLTTPPCSEAVLWIVNLNPVTINCNQLNLLRAIIDKDGKPTTTNYRPVQALNGRTVFRATGTFEKS